MEDKQLRAKIVRRLFYAQLGVLAVACAFVFALSFSVNHLGSFIFAFMAGCLGGSIALVRRLPNTERETMEFLASGWIPCLMPLLYGGLMAAVTYLLFMSGILTEEGGDGLFRSNLFPEFTNPGSGHDALLNMGTILQLRPASIEDAGKLLVWCFLSGFSENFVLGVLGALERRGGKKSNEDAT